MVKKTNENIAVRVSTVTIVLNVLLSVLKLLAGFIGNSAAMVSDAVHSLSDVCSTVVVIIGAKISSKESDFDHPYGHERFECICAAILSIMLGVTGLGIGYAAFMTIVSGDYQNVQVPGMIALVAAIVSIIIKEWMYRYTYKAGKQIGSGSLIADAWHHRSDALSSIGSLVGIAGAMLGYVILDSIAGLLISLLILKVAYDILKDALEKVTDKACDVETLQLIDEIANNTVGVIRIDDLKTRQFAERIYVDIEICVDGELTVTQGHDIGQDVHDRIECQIPRVKHCQIHINPFIKL